MPRAQGGLYQGLVRKRKELERDLATIDATIRLIHGRSGGRGKSKPRGPMSEATKQKLRAAAHKRLSGGKVKTSHKPKVRPLGVKARPKEMAAAAGA